jgi:hypothetical protein
MIKEDQNEKRLRIIEKRLTSLESRILESKTNLKSPSKITLSNKILHLRDSGFFSQPRTSDEVHKKLVPTYYCVLNRVEVALFRLASTKKLRKATKKINSHSYQAYVWQKQ